jgi:hypothetical protein
MPWTGYGKRWQRSSVPAQEGSDRAVGGIANICFSRFITEGEVRAARRGTFTGPNEPHAQGTLAAVTRRGSMCVPLRFVSGCDSWYCALNQRAAHSN